MKILDSGWFWAVIFTLAIAIGSQPAHARIALNGTSMNGTSQPAPPPPSR